MSTLDVCRSLGMNDDTLTAAEKGHLDEHGYLMLHGILTLSQAAAMRAACTEIFHAKQIGEPDRPAEIGDLQNEAPVFDICLMHPRVLAAVAHLLRQEFVSLGVHSRPNPPGKGSQDLHVDWGRNPTGHDHYGANSIWALTDFTEENGATRVVPGTHLSDALPTDGMADLAVPHPDEVLLLIPLGSVAVFSSQLWHSARLNRSDNFRPNVTSFWGRRSQRPAEFSMGRLGAEAEARLGPVAKIFAERC